MNWSRAWVVIVVLVTGLASAKLARAQDNYEIQVYGSDTVAAGHTMVELHSNFTFQGSKTIGGRNVSHQSPVA